MVHCGSPQQGCRAVFILKNIEVDTCGRGCNLNARMVKIKVDEIDYLYEYQCQPECASTVAGDQSGTGAPMQACMSGRSSLWMKYPLQYGIYFLMENSALSNAHTRADVTGYALMQDRPYQHTLCT